MFTKNHVSQIRKKIEDEVQKTIYLRATALEKAYKENPIVDEAKVSVSGEKIDVYVKLNFALKDNDQNIPGVLEYGGIIFDSEDKMHEIEPGFYIRRIMANGST